MRNVTFALPEIDTGGMSKDQQIEILNNQATAVIVTSWLRHARAMHESVLNHGWDLDGSTATSFRITPEMLADLINDVQSALKSY